ncbi:MAG TPA: methyltransferase domain-containing protein [Candidatus Acidoferrales bacterium]|nr:methyltransferase domain-containing protein [Bryobacteraceae bacterium]HTS62696.1 methyltransferase domain-containing protein [Candidatus Acidoferrales bacterium]
MAFTCNLCGAWNDAASFPTEPASCGCGSNVRLRALIHLLSLELFGESLALKDFPPLKTIRGIGLTDKECYAALLAQKFDYTNTHYDREPRFDIKEAHPHLAGTCDFILAADVLEHIAPPLEQAMQEMCRLLKPNGFLGITIYCEPGDTMREHFPEMHQYRVVHLGDSDVLINRRRDGTLEIREDLVFHGGSGETLEMREFGITGLRCRLLDAGFRDIHLLTADVPEIGVHFDPDVSQPLIARKEPYSLDPRARSELVGLWRRQAAQIGLAAQSRWIRLGRALGLGPKFS